MGDFPAALQSAHAWVEEIRGVQAVGECEADGEKCIYVYVTSPEASEHIPSEHQGYKVVIQHGEPIQLQSGDAVAE
jgi:hypothetical protein